MHPFGRKDLLSSALGLATLLIGAADPARAQLAPPTLAIERDPPIATRPVIAPPVLIPPSGGGAPIPSAPPIVAQPIPIPAGPRPVVVPPSPPVTVVPAPAAAPALSSGTPVPPEPKPQPKPEPKPEPAPAPGTPPAAPAPSAAPAAETPAAPPAATPSEAPAATPPQPATPAPAPATPAPSASPAPATAPAAEAAPAPQAPQQPPTPAPQPQEPAVTPQVAPPAPPPPAAEVPAQPPVSTQLVPVEVDVVARPVIFVTGVTTWEKAEEKLGGVFVTLAEAARKLGVQQAGPPLVEYIESDSDDVGFRAMVPIDAAPKGKLPKGVKLGKSTGGKALKFRHAGPLDDLEEVYGRIDDELAKRNIDTRTIVEEYDADALASPEDRVVMDIYVFPK